jgi:hypothetical protein
MTRPAAAGAGESADDREARRALKKARKLVSFLRAACVVPGALTTCARASVLWVKCVRRTPLCFAAAAENAARFRR